jgi:superfamily II DNA/RNA helicase
LINGTVPKKKRQDIVNLFNDPDGPNVLIITKAGGEGLDLKGVRVVILFEKGLTISGMDQVIGRAIRYKSHDHDQFPKRDNLSFYELET